MCLTIAKPERGIEIAKRDIRVYKVLRVDKGVGRSPYQRASYRRGEEKKITYFSTHRERFHRTLPQSTLGEPCRTIHAGLHSYTNKASARKYDRNFYVIVECAIPKGTKFLRGQFSEIVSLCLKVGKAISGNQKLVEAFNKTSVGSGAEPKSESVRT